MEGLLIIVPCGQRKIWDDHPTRGATPAREAYTGAPFKVNKKYAEHFAEQWVILSAKYGFIPPDFIIPGPYNVTFKKKSTNPVTVSALIYQVQEQGLHTYERVIGVGGDEYRSIIDKTFAGWGIKVSFPFAGLPIGKAMQATNRAVELSKPAPSFEDLR